MLPVFSSRELVTPPLLLLLGFLFFAGAARTRVFIAAMFVALCVADCGSERVIKNIVEEKRPYATLEAVHYHDGERWMTYDPSWAAFNMRANSNAFPSSHAANAAALATAFALWHPATLAVSVPFALLVGVSRIYTGNHYPGDVLGGYVWGALCAAGAWFLINGIATRFRGPLPIERFRFLSRERWTLFWILAAWTLCNFIFVHWKAFGLAADEAQYWDWSRQLDLGYYSKPPMIAYWMRIFTKLGGHHEWAIRTGAIVLSAGATACVYGLARRLTGRDSAGLLAAIASLAMPASWVGSVVMTIDPLLVFFWALAMYAMYRALDGERSFWLLAGLALGGGLLSKYTMIFLFISFALYIALWDRKWLRTPWPYLALAIALACNMGVLYWNWEHDWISFRHTAAIGAADKWKIGKALGWFAAFWGSQAALVSPLIFGFFCWAIWVCARRFRHDNDAAYLVLCFLPLFGFYALLSFNRAPEANWPICAWLAAAPALAYAWTYASRGAMARRLLAAALVVGCALGALPRAMPLVYAMDWSPRLDWDPTWRLIGGRELGAALGKYIGPKDTGPFPLSDRYQMTAYAAFYTPGRPRAYCVNLGRRLNQYDLWGGWEKLAGRDAIFVTGGDGDDKATFFMHGMLLNKMFESGEVLETVEVKRGSAVFAKYTLVRMHNFSGKAIEPPDSGY